MRLLAHLSLLTLTCEAFVSPPRLHAVSIAKNLAASNAEDDSCEDDTASPFALPPIGESSFWDQEQENKRVTANLSDLSSGIKISDEVASRKFQLQYTCKLCDTRNVIKVNRIAYRKGIVIAKCKGCENKHLIADNLNWLSGFDYDNGEKNIEQYMENRNEESGEEDLVVRVDKEVFDLEQVLYNNSDEERKMTSSGDNADRLDHWG